MGKDTCIKRMAAVRNYITNTIIKKKKKKKGGKGIKDMQFSEVLKK